MDEKKPTIGYIHSFESFGAVDGPGIRFVVFMQGCPLRCLFCHNADTWETGIGTKMTPKELVSKICEYKNFIKNGGVTFSGANRFYSMSFYTRLFRFSKKRASTRRLTHREVFLFRLLKKQSTPPICFCLTSRILTARTAKD